MGRGGGRSRGPVTREVQVSKKLSWLLRHGAVSEGLTLGDGGYINLKEVLNNRNIRSLKVTFDEVRAIVADNEKQRFSLVHQDDQSGTSTAGQAVDDYDPSHWLIRANQGHSLKVDDEGLLTPITPEADNLPQIVVHGTRREHWPKIVESGGLKPMGRNHVHFATGVPASLQTPTAQEEGLATAEDELAALPEKKNMPTTLSGMRNSSTVLMYLDLQKALASGMKFGLSDNGVVLSEGDENGMVKLELFKRVEERGGHVLLEDGKVVSQLQGKKFT